MQAVQNTTKNSTAFKGRGYHIMQAGFWSLFLLTLAVTVISGPPAIAFDKMTPEMGDAIKKSFAAMQRVIWIHNAVMIFCGILATHLQHLLTLKNRWDRLPLRRLLPVAMLNCVLFAVVISFLINSMRSYALGPSFGLSVKIHGVLMDYLSTGMLVFFLLGMWTTLYFACHAFTRLHQLEVTALRSDSAIKESRLQTIATQLNPHFLFNSLNTLRALIDENPEQARNAVTQLSLVLRASLSSTDHMLIPLRDELAVVNALLDLELARFGDRLKVTRKVEENCKMILIPPLLLVTLVENAVKHGVSSKLGPCFLRYAISLEEQRVKICVENSGNLSETWQQKGGIGLSHTRERLALLFGDKATMSIHQSADCVVATVFFTNHS